MIQLRLVLLLFFAGMVGASSAWASLAGVDSGLSARELIRTTDAEVLKQWGRTRPWIRIRELPDPMDPKRAEDVFAEREALGQLKKLGFRSVPHLRWSSASWAAGVRAGGGQRLPLDLREAHARARQIAETYGPVVTGLEFENEPDINFVEENAETYAAFQKACYLGVKAANRPSSLRLESVSAGSGVLLPVFETAPAARPLAIMAPMALPPGPFFEQLLANGILSYTDAFNYHFYGHADDFSRVYRQFEDAVGAGRAPEFRVRGSEFGVQEPSTVYRRLPVMLTEYGFSGVSGPERFGKEVRVAQWRWFRHVGDQIRELGIAAPMAFYLRPYYERKLIEFGLTAPAAPRAAEIEGRRSEIGKEEFEAGGLVFGPEDFEAQDVEPWMKRIGARVGGNEALPALAWLWDAAKRKRYRLRDWEIEVPKTSPIVIDLVAGAGLVQLKRYGGYMITGAESAGHSPQGRGEFAIYNFSEREIRGKLRWEGEAGTGLAWSIDATLVVPAMERVMMPFSVVSEATIFAGSEVKVVFEADDANVAPTVLVTHVYPSTTGMTAEVLERFDHAADAATRNRKLLSERPRASDERALQPAGRWMVSPHARIEELPNGRWRLVGAEFRRGPKVGRATVELPLRDDFVFPENAALRLSHRLAEATGLDADVERALFLEVYFRTANGNLYVVWPWARAQPKWAAYLELKDNYTMMFQSRANLPWRFAENRPVSLLFSFYSPTMDGAVVEIDRPEIVRIGR